MNKLEKFKKFYYRKLGEKEKVEKDIESYTLNLRKLNIELQRFEFALELVNKAALMTQKELGNRIITIVSTALDAVFDDPYEFEIEFINKRNQPEAYLWFVRKGNRSHPLNSSGLGAADIAAFALRINSIKMRKDLRQLLLADEPFKHLKGREANQRAIQMMKLISKKQNIQIITISDERAVLGDIIEGADKVFEVSQKKGISKVKELI